MISFVKKIFKNIKIKKLMKKYDEIENLINQKNYSAAEKILSDCTKISNKIENEKIFNLFKIYVLFLKQDYTNVIDLYPKIIQIINNSKTDDNNINMYYLLFVYTLVLISLIIEEKIDLKENLINKINNCYGIDYQKVDNYSLDTFPLYDNNKLLEYLKTHPLPEKLDEAKLEYLMVNLA